MSYNNSEMPKHPKQDRTANSITSLISPESVAVIGASADHSRIAGKPLKNLQSHGFSGRIYAVNPKYKEFDGAPCYPSVETLPEAVDCAIVLLAAEKVIPTLEALSLRKAISAIVVSGGFAEGGKEGRQLQDRISAIAKQSGMRILGPNTLGAVNFHSRAILSFSTSFEEGVLPAGPVGFVSQSGALLSSLTDRAADYGMGLSYAAATGNEADLDVSDFLEFFVQDEQTRIVMGLIESVQNGEKFLLALENLRRVKKPVVLLKVGKSKAGEKTALAHTGALAGSSRVFNAACKKSGVIQTDNLEDLLQTTHLLSKARLPTNRTLGIITTSGGAAALLADSATNLGFTLHPPSKNVVARLKKLLPPFAQQSLNPVDLTAQHLSQPEVYREIILEFLNDDTFGSVAVVMAPGSGNSSIERGETLVSLFHKTKKPLVACWIGGGQSSQGRDICRRNGLPTLDFPDHSATSLARLSDYAEAQIRFLNASKSTEQIVQKPIKPLPTTSGLILTEHESEQWLAACGIPVLEGRIVHSPEEAQKASAQLGFPVAIKGIMQGVLHKNQSGLVHLDINNSDDVLGTYQQLKSIFAKETQDGTRREILIEPMASLGVDLLVGTHIDPTFGPVVIFGWGGIHAEILDKTSMRLAPISEVDATEMMTEVQGFPKIAEDALGGNVEWSPFRNILVQISQIASNKQKELESIDLNPIRITNKNGECQVLDASVVLRNSKNA